MSRSRAAAAPWRTAGTVRGVLPLPAVMPSSGTRLVSAITNWIWLNGTRNSSAAAWLSSVRAPWPPSTLPVITVMVPSFPRCTRAAMLRAPPPPRPPRR